MESTSRLLFAEEQKSETFPFKHHNELAKSKRPILPWLGLILILVATNILSYLGGSRHSLQESTAEPDNPAYCKFLL